MSTLLAKSLTLGDVEVTRVGLGTNRLSLSEDHKAFVLDAVAEGIQHIDTAYLYAGGESERTIGAALSPYPSNVVVATKGGYRPGEGRPDFLRAQIDKSLGRLNTESIALYYLHRVDPQTPFEDSLGCLKEAQDVGKIRHIGISDVDVEHIERARRVVPIVAVQNHYSLTERKYDDVVDHCAQVGIVFVPYFPLRGVESPALTQVAERHGGTPSQVALAWLLRRSPTTLPIPGSLSVAHVRENLAALELDLSDEDLQELGNAGTPRLD